MKAKTGKKRQKDTTEPPTLECEEPYRLTTAQGSPQPGPLGKSSMHHGRQATAATAGLEMFEISSTGVHPQGLSKRDAACQTDERINPDDYSEVIRRAVESARREHNEKCLRARKNTQSEESG